MDFFKYFNFHFRFKRKYQYLFIGFVIAFIVWNILISFGYCSTSVSGTLNYDNSKFIDASASGSYQNGAVISSNDQSTRGIAYYYCSSPGTLTVTNGYANTRFYFVTSSIDIGTVLSNGTSLSAGESITLTVDTPGYFIINAGGGSQSYSYEFVFDAGMSSAVGGLITGLPSSDIWSVFAKSLPLVLVCVVVGFGNFIINRNVKKLSVGGSSDTYKRKGYYNRKKGYYYNASASARAKSRAKSKVS